MQGFSCRQYSTLSLCSRQQIPKYRMQFVFPRFPPQMPDVVIIGAGIGGLTAAIGLKRDLGVEDFVIYERGSDVGGTWNENTYPGAASDTYVHFYSLSSAPNPDWSSVQATQPEIHSYWRTISHKFDVHRHISFNTLVVSAEWDHQENVWRVETRSLVVGKGGASTRTTAKVLITAVGVLDVPRIPDILGLSSFKGEVFHSAKWRPDVDLHGKKVAVVGNAASATQLVPVIAQDSTTQVINFCRTPNWYLPSAQATYSSLWRWILRNVPLALWLFRMWYLLQLEILYVGLFSSHTRPLQKLAKKLFTSYIKSSAPKKYHHKMIPGFDLGCKRILFDNNYLACLHQPNVSMNWDGIAEVREDGLVTKTGEKLDFDVLIFATGFATDGFPIPIRGSQGKTIQEYYESEGYPKAYKGTSVSGFPNLFMIAGPNTFTGHTSVILFEELQVSYIVQLVRPLLAGILSTVDVTPLATDTYNAWIHARLARSVHMSCLSWYRIGGEGRISSIFPGPGTLFWWCLRRVVWKDYAVQLSGNGNGKTEWRRWVRRESSRRWGGRVGWTALALLATGFAVKMRA
ncbi:FAD/NAD-binding domain-containing protein [Mycena amicta]|nr:FAD/NAD-binding domain-containing protein [Mycena amicta]